MRAASVHTRVGIGSEFLGYRIDELIGRGGMGVVYRAYDLRLKRTVALKLVAPELALDERFRERFSRESELAMSLEHPNVVPIHDAGEIDGRVYLAMRLVDGSDLRSLLRGEGALDPARAMAICGQVAAALDAAHARGLVHRDVKPSNVLLDAGEHVYLADFGLTRRLEEQSRHPGDGRSLGTPAYLAPEQVEDQAVDGRADVYSLGCLLYECLTGEAPFPRDSRLAVAWAHLEEEPPRASERKPDLPEAVDAVIRKAMAKEREERYTSCAAMILAAETALGLRQPPIVRRRKLLIFAAAILVILAASLAAALVIRGDAKTAASAPAVAADTLVRIDPATNAISAVIYAGARPSATAVAGRRVWVYSHYDHMVTEIDSATTEVRQETAVSAEPVDLGLLTGPVLDADARGAWLVGVADGGTSLLTRVLPGGRGKREYRLDVEPRALAAGEGAVWVLGRGSREHEVQRVDPATGEITARTRFPASSDIDSLEVGLGAVWVVSSSSAVLYRIDPRSAEVSGQIDLGERAGRPVVRSGSIWIGVSDSGGTTRLVDPRTLAFVGRLDCCPLGEGYDTATGHGSTWAYDRATGTVVRWSLANHRLTARVHVADPPFYDGLCLTSIAAGAGAVWVTVASSFEGRCEA